MRVLSKSTLLAGPVAMAMALSLGCNDGGSVSGTAPSITAQPASLSIGSGAGASFTVAASGSPIPTFAWSRSNDSGQTWSAINGAVSATYSFTAQAADNGAMFHATASNALGLATSSAATLAVLPTVLVGGYSFQYGIQHAVTWTDGILASVGPIESAGSQIQAILISGADVITGGYAIDNLLNQVPGTWKNGIWTGLTPLTDHGNEVLALAGSGADLYAAGYRSDSASVPVPGYWLNGTWVGLPVLDSAQGGRAQAIAVDGIHVYAGGYCTKADGRTQAPGYWLDGAWVGLTPLSDQNGPHVTAISVSGGVVYAAGYNTSAARRPVAGYWRNGTWVGLNPPDRGLDGFVTSLVVSGNDVYAAGMCWGGPGGIPGYWKNADWFPLPAVPGAANTMVTAFALYGSDTYAAGYGDDSSGTVRPCYWKNGTRIDLSVLDLSRPSYACAIAVR